MSSDRLFRRRGGRVWYAWFYELDGRRRQKSTRCTDQRAAERVLREWERAAADPDHARTSAALVRDALGLVVTRTAGLVDTGRRSAQTANFYAAKLGHLSRLLEPGGRPTPLASLRASTVDDYVDARRREGAADTTVAKGFV